MIALGANDPQTLIQRTIEELRTAIVKDKQAIERDPNRAVTLVDQIVSPHVDTAKVGKLVLGKHWKQASPEQRERFIDSYRRLLLRTYSIHASDYTDVAITYLPLRVSDSNPGQVAVKTKVSRSGKPPVAVDYRLYETGGAWKLYDVTTDGISLVATFRASVDAEVKQHGIDRMLAELDKKNSQPLSARR
jgi:phospholipid transport system substrate-binding protein